MPGSSRALVPLVLVIPLAMGLSACGAGAMEGVEQLQTDYVDAGGRCDDLVVADDFGPWDESATCDDEKLLYTFVDADARDIAIESFKRLGEEETADAPRGRGMYGENWIIYPSSIDEEIEIAKELDANFFTVGTPG